MIKRNLIITFLILFCLYPVNAQVNKQEETLKREVTLYNPYKPSLHDSKKRSFLPDMNDTIRVKPDIHYDIKTEPYFPSYTISPIKPAALLPDPLPKLYKSFVNAGIGNYLTPLAEFSITNERSKKGSVGFYGKHFSSNGDVELQNGKDVFAGYMDNDASLFGRKIFDKSLLSGSVDFIQKTRYAYGYDTSIVNYYPEKKDIRMNYYNAGAKASLSSLSLDSSIFSYDFDIYYNYFHNTSDFFQNNFGIKGEMAKSINDLYVGSGISYDWSRPSDTILSRPKYITSISPFIKRSTERWNFKLGLQALLDKNMDASSEFHMYPDINFGFVIVPDYISFFSELSGKLEKNDPLKIISENPYLSRDGSLFKLTNTDHELILSAGLKGNSGLGGNYIVSATFSQINDQLFYSNKFYPENIFDPDFGNYFLPIYDDVDLFNFHSEMNGPINDKISFNAVANYNHYTVAKYDYAWNKPAWDAKLGLKYNLRDKILAGMELTAQGERKLLVTAIDYVAYNAPAYFNFNITAEYRYSKILSLWARFNNISFNRYYEWAYYPSQRFLCMVGFTYSL